jgi:acetyl-CoA carboxylase carboxyl transferase subunit alpha
MTEPVVSDRQVLEFERPIIDLERKIAELRGLSTATVDFSSEIRKLEQKARKLQKEIFAELSAWQKVQLARHPGRPHARLCPAPVRGLRRAARRPLAFRDDAVDRRRHGALRRWQVLVLGHQKGAHHQGERVRRNFGMARPEGYRKATRLMRMASRFKPADHLLHRHPGAYPGIDAEERGQAEAIAKSLQVMASTCACPMISGGDRRGRLGRRAGARRRRPHPDARVLDLLGDHARGLRLDPVARPGQDARSRRAAASDRAGSGAARRL